MRAMMRIEGARTATATAKAKAKAKATATATATGPRGGRAMSTRILAARGRETGRRGELEVAVETTDGEVAVTVREEDAAKAAAALEGEVSRLVNGLDPTDQAGVDGLLCKMDGTADRSEFTPGAILGVSVATAIAGAKAADKKLFAHLGGLSKRTSLQMPMPIAVLPALPNVSMIPFGDACFRDGIARFKDVFQDVAPAKQSLSYKAQLRALMRPLKSKDMLGEVALGLHIDDDADRDETLALMQKFPLALLQIQGSVESETSSLTAGMGEAMQILGGAELYSSLDRITHVLENQVSNGVLVDIARLGTVSAALDACALVEQASGVATVMWDAHLEPEALQVFLAHLALSQSVAAVAVGDVDGAFAKELCSLEALLEPRPGPPSESS